MINNGDTIELRALLAALGMANPLPLPKQKRRSVKDRKAEKHMSMVDIHRRAANSAASYDSSHSYSSQSTWRSDSSSSCDSSSSSTSSCD